MDIGDIIEHETETPEEILPITKSKDLLNTKKKVSRWKSKQQQQSNQTPPSSQIPSSNTLTESEKIHRENVNKMSQMSEEEILQEQQELLKGLDPKLVQSLINRSKKRVEDEHDDHHHAEGYNGWIGGMKTSSGISELSQLDEQDVNKALGLSSKKTVSFNQDVKTIDYEKLDEDVQLDPNGWEDATELDEILPNIDKDSMIAPEDYQINTTENNTVHFLKPKSNQEELDLNDPEFYNKLHEKYYPDLPKETEKLSWMTTPMPKQTTNTYESIADLRFDFKGNLIQLKDENDNNDTSTEVPTHLGLHHHSENPHLAGYTLSELAHLSRSKLPGQRCISIQTLGRILHKLGLHKYNLIDEKDTQADENLKTMMVNFESMIWDLIDELRIIDTLTEASDDKYTKNLSVKNYAIEALWLYKTGGGRPKQKVKTEEDLIIDEMSK